MKILLILLFKKYNLYLNLRNIFFVFVLICVPFSNIFSSEIEISESILRGLKIAQNHCSRCHVVEENNKFSSIETTPSFFGLRAMQDWELRFNEFYVRPPHPALVNVTDVTERSKMLPAFVSEIDLTLDQINDLVNYVRQLKKK